MRNQVQFDKMLLSNIVKTASSTCDEKSAISQILKFAGTALAIDRIYINEKIKDKFLNTFFWEGCCSEQKDAKRYFDNILDTDYKKMFANKAVCSYIRANDLKTELHSDEIKSAVFFKMEKEGATVGFACFCTCFESKEWTEEELEVLGIISDIIGKMLHRQRVESQLTHYNRMQEKIFNGIDAFIIVVDSRMHRIKFFNEKVQRAMEGIKVGDLCYKVLWNNKNNEECPFCAMRREDKCESVEFFNETCKTWLKATAVPIQWTDDSPSYLLTCIDISEQKNHDLNLKQLVYFDSKLGIGNRENCIRSLDTMFEDPFNPEGVMLEIDIDDFKHINDVCGHHMGDKLLKEIVAFFRGVGLTDNVYRVGGDEFIILLQGYDIDSARVFAEKIFKRFFGTWDLEDIRYKCSISMAMLKYPEHAKNSDEAISRLDNAVIVAKNSGKNQMVIYDDIIGGNIKRSNIIKNIAEKALVNNSYEVYYQPIYNIKKHRFVKAEALIRLYDEELGYISPCELIPIAEKTGIINDIGWFVLEESCKKLKELQRMGIDLESMNVNISPMQFMEDGFVERVMRIIKGYNIRPEKIEFEIIESMLIEKFDLMADIMKKLTAYGVKFAIDDFGTGYSALNYIIKLPFNTLKLDKSIVDMIEVSPRSQIMVEGLVELANKFNMQTVAEGVETRSQLKLLEKMGCNIIQGYYYAKPVPGDKLFKEIMTM